MASDCVNALLWFFFLLKVGMKVLLKWVKLKFLNSFLSTSFFFRWALVKERNSPVALIMPMGRKDFPAGKNQFSQPLRTIILSIWFSIPPNSTLIFDVELLAINPWWSRSQLRPNQLKTNESGPQLTFLFVVLLPSFTHFYPGFIDIIESSFIGYNNLSFRQIYPVSQ